MKTEHYPDVRLCVQLTKLGFPKTYKTYNTEDNINFLIQEGGSIVCPNVMELLDELPKNIGYFNEKALCIEYMSKGVYVEYNDGIYVLHIIVGTLPNALAEMYIWMKENNYLTK